ncbi:hypothetical protein K2173_018705 [Erythroxylum novogranatense]|uniref:Uncharacterized protein n=1 Tax=Erythroxylum novogranatense TaxID=1862640 RepID=A0AAV8SAQ6_9ROSI|nr:hypothetical protein K2173_018705 [Erythroxylum novogranatense]
MVVPLGPGKFYGSGLPRPRIYTDVKFNVERIDPPASVMEPFLTWAREAHWSMGGLSFERLRLQGRIEGNIDRLRKQKDKQAKLEGSSVSPNPVKHHVQPGANGKSDKDRKRVASISPPPAPKVAKRRKFVEESEEEETIERVDSRKQPARKLVGDFDRVAKENVANVTGKMRTRKMVMQEEEDCDVMTVVEEVSRGNSKGKKLKSRVKGNNGQETGSSSAAKVLRTSPRFAKRKQKLVL